MGILVDRVHRVTEGLTDDEKGGFRSRREYVVIGKTGDDEAFC